MKTMITEQKRKGRFSFSTVKASGTVESGVNGLEKPAQSEARARQEPLGKSRAVPALESKASQSAVLFQRFLPFAKLVCVAGSFNDWQPAAAPMKNIGGGRWSLRVPLKPGRYEYRLVVDGNWTDDPIAKSFVPNPYGTCNSVLFVPLRAATSDEQTVGPRLD